MNYDEGAHHQTRWPLVRGVLLTHIILVGWVDGNKLGGSLHPRIPLARVNIKLGVSRHPRIFCFNCASAYIHPQPDITSLDNGITSLRHQTRSVTTSEKFDLVSPIWNVFTRVSSLLMTPLSRIYIKFGVSRPPNFFSFRVVVCGSLCLVHISI